MRKKNFPVNLQQRKILEGIFSFARRRKLDIYLVGGFLRDALLNRSLANHDIDLVIKNNAIPLACSLSKKLKAGFVILDQKHGCCRLVKRISDQVYTIDLSDFRAKDLLSDLHLRDFTINSLALHLKEAVENSQWKKEIIDPLSALKDFKGRIIRKTYPDAFRDDPIRILRAFSLSCALNFHIEKNTLRDIEKERLLINKASGERIRDVLFEILTQPQSYDCLLRMDKIGLLSIIFPEFEKMRGLNQGPYHHLDVLRHSFETLKQLEKLLQNLTRSLRMSHYLNQVIVDNRRRFALMKLGALLHDIGKPQAKRVKGRKVMFRGHERLGAEIVEDICRRLRLANSETEILKKMVFLHLRPGYLGDSERPTPRAVFRYFRDAGNEAASILLISLADQRSTRGRLTNEEASRQHEKVCFYLIREFFKRQVQIKPARLLNGFEIMREFSIDPSPLVGRILSALEELQAIGRIKTKEEALKEARRIFEQLKNKKNGSKS